MLLLAFFLRLELDRAEKYFDTETITTKPNPAAKQSPDELADHLSVQLERLMQGLMLSRVAQIDLGLDMTPAEVHTVRMLSQGPLTMSTLAEALGVPLSTATHRVDKLVKRKLATRGRSAADRRVVEVSLTAKGRSLDERMHDVHRQTSQAMLAPLSAAERQVLIGLITKINEAQG